MTDKAIASIARDCGDDTMKESASYIQTARYFGGEKFRCYLFGDKAFYYGIRGKAHFRLIAIAVRKEFQKSGVATALLSHIILMCEREHLGSITLRTHKHGKALPFWTKMGAVIVGEKGDDYEMKIVL